MDLRNVVSITIHDKEVDKLYFDRDLVWQRQGVQPQPEPIPDISHIEIEGNTRITEPGLYTMNLVVYPAAAVLTKTVWSINDPDSDTWIEYINNRTAYLHVGYGVNRTIEVKCEVEGRGKQATHDVFITTEEEQITSITVSGPSSITEIGRYDFYATTYPSKAQHGDLIWYVDREPSNGMDAYGVNIEVDQNNPKHCILRVTDYVNYKIRLTCYNASPWISGSMVIDINAAEPSTISNYEWITPGSEVYCGEDYVTEVITYPQGGDINEFFFPSGVYGPYGGGRFEFLYTDDANNCDHYSLTFPWLASGDPLEYDDFYASIDLALEPNGREYKMMHFRTNGMRPEPVPEPIYVDSISISGPNSIDAPGIYDFYAVYNPSNANEYNFRWSFVGSFSEPHLSLNVDPSNPLHARLVVAEASSSFSAAFAIECEDTVSHKYNRYSVAVDVYVQPVIPDITSITVSGPSSITEIGDYDFYATIYPAGASADNLRWTGSSEGYAINFEVDSSNPKHCILHVVDYVEYNNYQLYCINDDPYVYGYKQFNIEAKKPATTITSYDWIYHSNEAYCGEDFVTEVIVYPQGGDINGFFFPSGVYGPYGSGRFEFISTDDVNNCDHYSLTFPWRVSGDPLKWDGYFVSIDLALKPDGREYEVMQFFTNGMRPEPEPEPDPLIGVDLNSQWVESTYNAPSDMPSNYRMYMSNSNHNVNNGVATMYINVGATYAGDLIIFINSYAESDYDYTSAYVLDSTSSILTDTKGFQWNPSVSLSNYKAVKYVIPDDNAPHRIKITYKKDISVDKDYDRGFVLVPIDDNVPDIPDVPDVPPPFEGWELESGNIESFTQCQIVLRCENMNQHDISFVRAGSNEVYLEASSYSDALYDNRLTLDIYSWNCGNNPDDYIHGVLEIATMVDGSLEYVDVPFNITDGSMPWDL